MEDWLERWNTRYQEEEYAYGTVPNVFLKSQLDKLKPGKILFAAEGEGRNAVYAARQGWDVSAFDISQEGKNKASQLAAKHNLTLDYRVGELPELGFGEEQFDTLVLIYAHFPPLLKSPFHKLLSSYLKKGGTVIFEAFGKDHLKYREQNPKVGGPGNYDMLFSTKELRNDFEGFEILELVEEVTELKEGLYHNGVGSVVRFVGKKK